MVRPHLQRSGKPIASEKPSSQLFYQSPMFSPSAALGAPMTSVSALITQTLADLVIADKHVPPKNGKACMTQLERAFCGLDMHEFTLAEFNVPTNQPAASSRVAQLLTMLAAEAATAAANAPASPTPSSPSSPPQSSPSSPPAVKIEPVGTGARSTMIDLTSSYAPRSLTSTTNNLSSSTSSLIVRTYINPITKLVEEPSLAVSRSLCQRMLERVFIPHHAHVISTCANGDISAIWATARSLCLGNSKKTLLDTIAEMVAMVSSPPAAWSEMAVLLARISLRFSENTSDDPNLRVGTSMLPEFTLRALQHSNFDYLRLEVTMLSKINVADGSSISLARIVQDMGAAHSQSLSQPTSQRAFIAPVVATTAAARKLQVCFHFRDRGTCRNGDNCRFSHIVKPGAAAPTTNTTTATTKPTAQLDVTCLVCNSKSHGIQDCRRHKAQQKAATQTAQMAKVEAEMSELRALIASQAAPAKPAPPVPTALPAATTQVDQHSANQEIQRLRAQLAASHATNWDPYYQYGPGNQGQPGP